MSNSRISALRHIASSDGGAVPRDQLVRHHLPLRAPHPMSNGSGFGSGGGGTVAQGLGRVLTKVHVRPIFWGTAWYHPATPSVADIMWAIQTIFLGPYFSGLSQYGVGVGTVDPTPIFTGLSVDPPLVFSDADLRTLLVAVIEGTLPGAAGSFNAAFDDQ